MPAGLSQLVQVRARQVSRGARCQPGPLWTHRSACDFQPRAKPPHRIQLRMVEGGPGRPAARPTLHHSRGPRPTAWHHRSRVRCPTRLSDGVGSAPLGSAPQEARGRATAALPACSGVRLRECRFVSVAAPWRLGTAPATTRLRDSGCFESAMRIAASHVACFRGLLRGGAALRHRKPPSHWRNQATLSVALAVARAVSCRHGG